MSLAPDVWPPGLREMAEDPALLRAIVGHSLDAILLADDDRRYVWANQAAADLTGYAAADLLGLRIDELTHPSERDAVDDLWRAFIEDGRLRGRFDLQHRDGRKVSTEFQAVANIRPGLHLSVMHDVTDQRASEEALQRSERRLRALVGNAADVVMIVGADRRIVFASQATERVLGYPPIDVVGRDLFVPFVHPDELATVVARWTAVLADDAQPDPCVVHVRGSDGDYRALDMVLTDLRHDDAVGGVVLHARDVTDREAALAHLKDRERRFRHIADNAQDAIIVYRLAPERSVEYVSAAIEPLIGYTPSELYAQPELRYRFLHPDDVGDFRRALADEGSNAPFTMRWIHRDGHVVWVEARGRVVRDADGRPVAIEAIVRDTTARRRAEDALRTALEDEQAAARRRSEVDRLRSAFLQATSHELRTPLTSILGFSELLAQHLEELDPDRLRDLLLGISRNAQRLDRLIADLLDVDQLSRGLLRSHRSSTRIYRLLADAVNGLKYGDRRVTIDGPSELEAAVDIARTQRIVENLVVNAVRHTPSAGRIWVRFRREGAALHLAVEDEGPGVPDDLKLSVFEAFVQGDTPASRTGGVGIGLAVVKRYAEVQGGRAWVEDRPGGGGASFQVLLPDTDAKD